ncbi:MAG: lipocalin family protein [Myxococcus sp.]|nr:lipocalin family protein [Myxococcus sp.]
MRLLTLTCAALVLVSCKTSTTERLGLPPLTTVPKVELNRYLGTWYEIGSFPQSFQKGCTGTTATYSLREDGLIRVENRCRKDALDGPENVAVGRARVVDPSGAKLEVSFFGPFWGDYWVIDLAEDYSFAVVGNPSRDYLWVLSRRPTMPAEVLEGIRARLAEKSYTLERFVMTTQPATP